MGWGVGKGAGKGEEGALLLVWFVDFVGLTFFRHW